MNRGCKLPLIDQLSPFPGADILDSTNQSNRCFLVCFSWDDSLSTDGQGDRMEKLYPVHTAMCTDDSNGVGAGKSDHTG